MNYRNDIAPRQTGGKIFNWVDGRPIAVYSEPLNKQQISDLLTASLSAQYTGRVDPETGEPTGLEERFAGMTNAEVLAVRLIERAAEGDSRATTEVLDRVLGKPKQSVETIGVRMTYKDFVEGLSREEETDPYINVSAVDVSIYDEDPLEGL